MRSIAGAAGMLSAVLAATFALPAGSAKRDSKARAEFKRAHPCPATGQARGACPGYVVDHIRPICAGGPDTPANVQWQTVAEAKAKDQLERQECNAYRRGK
jgi:hypothetical protein